MKRLLAISMVLALAVSFFTACSNKIEETGGGSDPDVNQITSPSPTNQTDPASPAQQPDKPATKNPMGKITADSKPFGAYDVVLEDGKITGTVKNNSNEKTRWQICFETFDENGEPNYGSMLAYAESYQFLEPGEEEDFSITADEGTVAFKYEKFNLATEVDEYLRDAERLIFTEDFNEAQAILDSVLEADPNNTEAKRLQGKIQDEKAEE